VGKKEGGKNCGGGGGGGGGGGRGGKKRGVGGGAQVGEKSAFRGGVLFGLAIFPGGKRVLGWVPNVSPPFPWGGGRKARSGGGFYGPNLVGGGGARWLEWVGKNGWVGGS